jgi:hypothetical protein
MSSDSSKRFRKQVTFVESQVLQAVQMGQPGRSVRPHQSDPAPELVFGRKADQGDQLVEGCG